MSEHPALSLVVLLWLCPLAWGETSGPILRAGDQITITVYDHPDYQPLVVVPPDGRIVLPLIGAIPDCLDVSPETLAERVRVALADGYIVDPVVSVHITIYAPRQVSVLGHVGQPGVIELTPGTAMTSLQAISRCGGFLADANRQAARLIRRGADQSLLSLEIPASNAVSELQHDPRLQAGDLIIVPQLERIFVIGRVRAPGAVNLPSEGSLSVSKAISLAGGFAEFAREGAVVLLREGAPVRNLDIQSRLQGDEQAEDPFLQPGDTVYVPESRF